MTCTILFEPFGRRIETEAGTTIFRASLAGGILLRSDCGEKGTCGKCRVVVDTPDNLSPRTDIEERILKKRGPTHRLACQAKVLEGPLRVTVPEKLLLRNEVYGKTNIQGKFPVNPAVKRYALTAARIKAVPAGACPSQAERIAGAVETVYGEVPDIGRSLPLQQLSTPGTYDGDLTLVHHDTRGTIAVRPGFHPEGVGLAFDIGTTTIAAYLCDMTTGEILVSRAVVNPQRRFGEDVISRIAACGEAPGAVKDQQILAVGAMNDLISHSLKAVGKTFDAVDEITVVGNTTMQHLFCGINPHSLGLSPYLPVQSSALTVTARDLGLSVGPQVPVYMFPVISGFLGGDILAACLGDQAHTRDQVTLIIDIGTNGELMLCTGDEIWATSCATGPALEGAQISCGMRAATGAVSRVWVEEGQIRHTTIGEAPAAGICGSGVIDIAAALRRSGTTQENGRFDGDKPDVTCDETGMGRAFTLPGSDVRFLLKDVRQVQLAKAALCVGIEYLLERSGVDRVDRTILTGAFGAKFNWQNARDIGMLPQMACEAEMISAENLAGTGAVMALLDKTQRADIQAVARQVKFLDLTSEPDFVMRFSGATQFPPL